MPKVFLVLDDEIGNGAMDRAAVFDEGVHAERVCSALCDANELVLPFNGQVFRNGTSQRLNTPEKCVTELLRRLRVSVANFSRAEIDNLEIRVLLDLEWFHDPDFGRDLLDLVFRRWKTGRIGRVIVYSKWTNNEQRREFMERFEIPAVHCLDKPSVSIERTVKMLIE